MTNPYDPPYTEPQPDPGKETSRLLFIWIWLASAILGAMLISPADIFSIAQALAFALPCSLCGVSRACNLNWKVGWTLTIVCVLFAGWLAPLNWSSHYEVLFTILFAAMNGALGYKAATRVVHDRGRIFGALGVAYTLGILLGPLGVLLLTIPAVLLVNRNSRPTSAQQ